MKSYVKFNNIEIRQRIPDQAMTSIIMNRKFITLVTHAKSNLINSQFMMLGPTIPSQPIIY